MNLLRRSTRRAWLVAGVALAVLGLSTGAVIVTVADAPRSSCIEDTLPGRVLTDDIVDRGCTMPNGSVFVGATYRCTDGGRLWADGFRVWGFVGQPLERGDGTLNGYANKVTKCLMPVADYVRAYGSR